MKFQISTVEDKLSAALLLDVGGILLVYSHSFPASSSNHSHHSFDEAVTFGVPAIVQAAAVLFAGVTAAAAAVVVGVVVVVVAAAVAAAAAAAALTVVFASTAAASGAAAFAVSVAVSASSAPAVVSDADVEAYWNLAEVD